MNQIFELLKTKTVKDSFATSFGTVINGLLGILFYIILARNLGPNDFGIFTIATTTLILLSDIGNLGTDTGLIRFIGKYKESKFKLFLKLGLEIKILAWIVILIFGWVLMPFLCNTFFQKSELIYPLRLSLIGVGGLMLISFASSALQGLQRYWSWSILNIAANLTRLLLVTLTLFVLVLNLESALLIYIVVPFVFFVIALFLIPMFVTEKNEFSVSKEFFTFNKWIALLSLIAALSSRLDTYLAAKFLSIAEVGLYGVVLQLSGVLPQLIFAFASVIAPKLAIFNTDKQAFYYLKKVQLLTLGIAFLGVLVIPLVSFLIPLIYGNEFSLSIGAFAVLFIAQLFFLLSLPSHQAIFYYFGEPKVFVIFSLINLLIIAILGVFLIPHHGIIGAATVVLIGNIINFIVPLGYVLKRFSKKGIFK